MSVQMLIASLCYIVPTLNKTYLFIYLFTTSVQNNNERWDSLVGHMVSSQYFFILPSFFFFLPLPFPFFFLGGILLNCFRFSLSCCQTRTRVAEQKISVLWLVKLKFGSRSIRNWYDSYLIEILHIYLYIRLCTYLLPHFVPTHYECYTPFKCTLFKTMLIRR